MFNSIRLFYEYNYNILPGSYQGSKRGYRHHTRKYLTFSHRTGNQCPLPSYSNSLRPAHRRSNLFTARHNPSSRQQSTQSLRPTSSRKLGTSPILRAAFTPLSTLIQHPKRAIFPPYFAVYTKLHRNTLLCVCVCFRVILCFSPKNTPKINRVYQTYFLYLQRK